MARGADAGFQVWVVAGGMGERVWLWVIACGGRQTCVGDV